MVSARPYVVVLVGPTAVGKTSLSLALAEQFTGEIVNADSTGLYRGLDIGTAKPTAEERQRVCHHLLDIVDPNESVTLAEYQKLAYGIIDQILARGGLPIVVGGSGLYIRAIIKAYRIPEVPPSPEFREGLEREALLVGKEALYRRLVEVDPSAAARIDHRDVRRVIRALEVYHFTGVPISQLQEHASPPYELIVIGLYRPREQLLERIDLRIEAMIKAGFVDEVEQLLRTGFSPELPAMGAIGYRQIAAYLQGKITFEEALREMRKLTINLMYQQSKWFRMDDPSIFWVDASQTNIFEQVREFLLSKGIASQESPVT